MKKLIIFFLSLLATLSCIFTVTACKDGGSNNEEGNNGGNPTIPDDTDKEQPHTHSFGEWIVTKSATCTQEGAQSRYCSCGEEQKTTIGAIGHNLQHYEAQEATCTVKGWASYDTCSRCDYNTYKEISPLGHALTHYDGQDATYTADGWEEYDSCSRCDYTTYKVIPAFKHNLVEHAGKTATCTKGGWEDYVTCSECDYTTYKTIPALGHDKVPHVGKTATCTNKGWNAYDTCSRCDYSTFKEIAALGHNIQHNEGKEATCTENGWYAYDACTRCNYTTFVEIKAWGHSIQHHTAKMATCTENGWDEYDSCSRCSYSTYQEIKPIGHDEVVHIGKTATCTEKGWSTYVTCTRCDYSTYQELLPTGHIFGDWNVIIAPTCINSGAYMRICSCGETESKNVEALGHNTVTHVAKAATCTEIGWEQYEKCSRCNYSTYVELSALGHTPVDDIGYPATCAQSGLSDGSHCTVCGDVVIEQTYTDALHILYTYDEEQDAYIVSGIASDCDERDLILVNEYKGKPVVAIGERAFIRYRSLIPGESVSGVYIRKVTIPEGIVSIGADAFYNRSYLQEVTIPSTVTYIGSYAFDSSWMSNGKDNYYQPTYNLRINITDLSAWCRIKFGKSVFTVPYDSYIKGYEKRLYLDGSVIYNLVIPDEVTEISNYAFRDYGYLSSVKFGENITDIDSYIFSGCRRLESVTIPDSVTSIGSYAFDNCSIKNIYISDISKWLNIAGLSGLMDHGSSNKHIFLNGKEIINLTIPDSVTSIGRYAFSGCSSITSIEIPDSVTSIGSYAFSGCSRLASVILGNNVMSIGYWAFDGCTSLETVYYKGSAVDWSKISISSYNTRLEYAKRYYYSENEPALNNNGTDYDGKYWHYDTDGVTPVIWKKEN